MADFRKGVARDVRARWLAWGVDCSTGFSAQDQEAAIRRIDVAHGDDPCRCDRLGCVVGVVAVILLGFLYDPDRCVCREF